MGLIEARCWILVFKMLALILRKGWSGSDIDTAQIELARMQDELKQKIEGDFDPTI